jgi:hypothetical protein
VCRARLRSLQRAAPAADELPRRPRASSPRWLAARKTPGRRALRTTARRAAAADTRGADIASQLAAD